MAGDIHEVEIFRTEELNLGTPEQTVMFLADEQGIVDRFATNIVNVRLRADDTDVIGVRFQPIQSDMLAYQDPDADPRHVEPVQESLYRLVDVRRRLLPLVFENASRDGRHDGIMPFLNVAQELREPFVVIVDFWWPFDFTPRVGVIPLTGRRKWVRAGGAPKGGGRRGQHTDVPKVPAAWTMNAAVGVLAYA